MIYSGEWPADSYGAAMQSLERRIRMLPWWLPGRWLMLHDMRRSRRLNIAASEAIAQMMIHDRKLGAREGIVA